MKMQLLDHFSLFYNAHHSCSTTTAVMTLAKNILDAYECGEARP